MEIQKVGHERDKTANEVGRYDAAHYIYGTQTPAKKERLAALINAF
jgi:hypothetical protein